MLVNFLTGMVAFESRNSNIYNIYSLNYSSNLHFHLKNRLLSNINVSLNSTNKFYEDDVNEF